MRIFDGTGGVMENGSILFDEDKIIEVSDQNLNGERNIDGLGKTITPGLIDCHVHMGGMSGEKATDAACIAYQASMVFQYGITSVRNAAEPNNADILVRGLIHAGQIKGCRIVAAGKYISITGGCPGGCGVEVDTPDEMRKAVRKQIKEGADFIKLGATGSMNGKNSIPGAPLLSEEMMRVAVEEATRTGLLVMVHATSTGNESAQRAARAGVRSIEHIQMNEDTARIMKENGTYYCPTIVTRYIILHNTDPQYMWMTKKAKPEDLDRKKEALQLCLKYGIPIVAGTDAGSAMVPIGKTLPVEIGLYVEFGLTPGQALQAATKTAAEMMRIIEETGTLEPGKKADIAMFDGNPLQFIDDLKKVVLTIHNGEVVYQA